MRPIRAHVAGRGRIVFFDLPWIKFAVEDKESLETKYDNKFPNYANNGEAVRLVKLWYDLNTSTAVPSSR